MQGRVQGIRGGCLGSLYTQRTIDLVKRVRTRNPAIGTVIQSYLYRSETDVADLLAYGCRIRLCKGAYKESQEVAFPRKADVDANFIRLMQFLLSSGFYHGIATHDPRMIAATIRHAAAKQISKDDFEFQMLYGVRTDLQRRLVKDGYRVRIYIPFGRDWFPYFMRRLAERPANLGFLVPANTLSAQCRTRRPAPPPLASSSITKAGVGIPCCACSLEWLNEV